MNERRRRDLAVDLAGAAVTYAKIAWWGLGAPRLFESGPLVVPQAVVTGEDGVLLAIRSDLRGWELPGGTPDPGEPLESALCREVMEETGLVVEVVRHVGDYERRGFRPHVAKVYLCRATGGNLRTSAETRAVRWFDPARLPDTLFPWYRRPLANALAGGHSISCREWQGVRTVAAAIRIDLRMRVSADRAG